MPRITQIARRREKNSNNSLNSCQKDTIWALRDASFEVKRTSSAVVVRLTFAVAAHLEPDILLVDEVLAVGDAAFQKECLGKMGDVAKVKLEDVK